VNLREKIDALGGNWADLINKRLSFFSVKNSERKISRTSSKKTSKTQRFFCISEIIIRFLGLWRRKSH
jgi:hypothetical protein